MIIDNPASRFLQIILEGKNYPHNHPALNAWSEILHTDIDNTPFLLSKIGTVISLPKTIQEQILSLNEIDHSLHLKWLPKVEQSFSTLNFQVQWSQFINFYDDAVIYGLEICSDLLSRRIPEKAIENEKIMALLEEINSLIEEITKDGLPEDLVNYLLSNLLNIKNALENYELIGTKGIEKEIQSIIGSIVINNNFYHKTKEIKVGDKVWGFLGKLAILVTLSGANPIQIGNEVIFDNQPIEPSSTTIDDKPNNLIKDSSNIKLA